MRTGAINQHIHVTTSVACDLVSRRTTVCWRQQCLTWHISEWTLLETGTIGTLQYILLGINLQEVLRLRKWGKGRTEGGNKSVYDLTLLLGDIDCCVSIRRSMPDHDVIAPQVAAVFPLQFVVTGNPMRASTVSVPWIERRLIDVSRRTRVTVIDGSFQTQHFYTCNANEDPASPCIYMHYIQYMLNIYIHTD
jgi:hypothetical protein